MLESLGFKALATTSSGFAFTMGRADGKAALEDVVRHVEAVAAGTSIALAVDLENGHGPTPANAAEAIALAGTAGAVGGSIEDYDPDDDRIYDRERVERIARRRRSRRARSATTAEKGAAFRALHEGEPFLIPNPWDAGSAKVLESLGFKALATTSSGFAFTMGRADGKAALEDVVRHTEAVAAATSVPLAVDLENGHGPTPANAAEAIALAGTAGAVGGSIEDYDPGDDRIYDLDHAVERIAAAAKMAAALPFDFTLTARAEQLLHGSDDLDGTIARLQAYADAGADVLFAPGLRSLDQVRAVCSSVSKPVNVLGHRGFASVGELFEAGAQRVSVGGALTWVAVAALTQAAEALRDGDLSVLAASAPKELLG